VKKYNPQKITNDVVVLTPEMAEEFLKHNQGNRRLSEKLAFHYGEVMEAGNWVDGVAEIAFDEKGRLINGQHVCTACFLVGTSCVVRVVRNMSPQAFVVYDTGKRRTGAQALELSGFKLGAFGYPFLRLVWLWQEYEAMEGFELLRARKKGRIFSNEKAVMMAAKMDAELPHYFDPDFIKAVGPTKGGAVAIFCRWLFDQINEKKCERFFNKFLGYEGNKDNCPIRALKNSLLNNERLVVYEKIHLFVTAWNAFYNNEKRRVIYRPREGSKIPAPLGL